MKKFMVVIVVFLVVLSASSQASSFSLLNYFSGDYTAYTSTQNGDEAINLGFCYMNTKPGENIVGESMVIKNFEVSSVLETLKARVVKTEYLTDGTIVIYAFTNLIKDQIRVDNQLVNLQIAEKQDYHIIGWPLILGSY